MRPRRRRRSERWVRRWNRAGENGQDLGRDVDLGPGGEVYVGGDSYSGETSFDFVLIKYDSAGNQQWVRLHDGDGPPGAGIQELARVRADSQGDVVVTGSSQHADTTPSFATLKYDPDGYLLWLRTHQSAGGFGDHPVDLAIGPEDGVYVTDLGSISRGR